MFMSDAEIPLGLTILFWTIIWLFVLSVWFVYRMGQQAMEHRPTGPTISFGTPGQSIMGQVYNPYAIEMIQKSSASLADGATFSLTAQLPCELRLYWGVDIKEIFPVIHQPWYVFSEQLMGGSLLAGACLTDQEVIQLDACENHVVHVQPPLVDSRCLDLGQKPRGRYPLVIVITHPSGASAEEEKNQIVCVVLIVHLKDEVCPGESRVLAHYVRTTWGAPHNMLPLYVASADSTEQDSAPVSAASGTLQPPDGSPACEQSGSSNPVCVVCQTASITRAILPCRHACVCHHCFPKLQQCPMCRGYIMSYFTMDSRDGLEDAEDDLDNAVQDGNWFMRMNNRLKQFFEFT